MPENKKQLAVFIDGSNLYFKLKSLQIGKAVEYIGFGHQPSLALQTFATISRLLIKDELKPFIYANTKA